MSSFSFDAYEYVAYILPGTVLLVGLGLLFPQIRHWLDGGKIDFAKLGAFVIAAFILGQLLYALGSFLIVESGFRPYATDYIASGQKRLLLDDKKNLLTQRIKDKLKVDSALYAGLATSEQKETWRNVVRQIIFDVHQTKKTERLDIFARGYALHLGLATSFIVLAAVAGVMLIITLARGGRRRLSPSNLALLAVCVVAAWISLGRMTSFADNYARELFSAYLSI